MNRCDNSSDVTCASDDQIDAFFDGKKIRVPFTKNYFNQNSYVPFPIDMLVDDSVNMRLEPGRTKVAEVFVMKSSVSLYDAFFQWGQYVQYSYAEVQAVDVVDEKYFPTDPSEQDSGGMARVQFKMDSKSSSYEREITTALDYLSNIGGLFSLISAAGLYFVGFVRNRLYIASLLKKSYMVKRPQTKNIKTNKVQDLNSTYKVCKEVDLSV